MLTIQLIFVAKPPQIKCQSVLLRLSTSKIHLRVIILWYLRVFRPAPIQSQSAAAEKYLTLLTDVCSVVSGSVVATNAPGLLSGASDHLYGGSIPVSVSLDRG